MLTYPQLATGALAQFPIRKRRRMRTVVNAAADGSSIKLGDLAAPITEWRLEYAQLMDAEREALEAFFAAAEGTLNGFTFLDPTANLLAWSTDLNEDVWELDPFLSASSGVMDPTGGALGWSITNGGAGPQSIGQTLAVPGEYLYCFSAYLRAQEDTAIAMTLAGARKQLAATGQWRRMALTATGEAGATSVRFGIEIPADGRVEVFGLQAEPQAGASAYKGSAESGVYEGARFRDDELAFQATGLNRHSCTVNIIHAKHL
jgi:hypothetical protein